MSVKKIEFGVWEIRLACGQCFYGRTEQRVYKLMRAWSKQNGN